MYFYDVLVASQRYHGDKTLTYSSESALSSGQIVAVPLQRQQVLGIVIEETAKPAFTAKPIDRIISEQAVVPRQLVDLITWLSAYYPAPLGQTVSLVLPTTLLQRSRKQTTVDEAGGISKKLPKLTREQQEVVTAIERSNVRMHLIHGDTGTGKTRVYMELVRDMMDQNLSSIVLTPEIGLTPQLARTLDDAFPGKTVTLHSELTPAERRNRWLRIATSNEALIVIGPRSALFSPLKSVGLIILDEEHDSAYKQEQAPHYLASRVAAKLAELHGAKVILGSATPLVADYYTFKQKDLPIHRMSELAVAAEHSSETKIINLRDRDQFSRSNWLSDSLIESIERAIRQKSQSLVFLNRRGSARLVLCQSCGWQAVCPRCDVPLTYHGDRHRMLCHTCGYSSQAPSSCPSCSSTELTFKSIGTKALASEIEKLFPKARIMRFDSDNVKAESLENQYDAVRSGNVDIIVGTQLLAKGLDLPRLGVVGIVVADSGLYFPDFTAEERTFQLINQVIGRAGRGHRESVVILQTYHPDNQTIMQALVKDYDSFYNNQLIERRSYKFPPFRFLLKIQVERASSKAAEKAAAAIWQSVSSAGLQIELTSPAPAFIEKSHNRYRWQIVVRAVKRDELLKITSMLPAKTSYDIDPTDLL